MTAPVSAGAISGTTIVRIMVRRDAPQTCAASSNPGSSALNAPSVSRKNIAAVIGVAWKTIPPIE